MLYICMHNFFFFYRIQIHQMVIINVPLTTDAVVRHLIYSNSMGRLYNYCPLNGWQHYTTAIKHTKKKDKKFNLQFFSIPFQCKSIDFFFLPLLPSLLLLVLFLLFLSFFFFLQKWKRSFFFFAKTEIKNFTIFVI